MADTDEVSTEETSSPRDDAEEADTESKAAPTASSGENDESVSTAAEIASTVENADDGSVPSTDESVSPALSDNKFFGEPKAKLRSHTALVHDRDLLICSILIVAIMLGRLLYTVYLHPLAIGWDPSLHLNAAQLILEGKIPYVDMLDANPPLVWYLDMIPAFFSNLFNFPVTQAFSLFLIGIIFYSVATCGALLFTKAKRAEAPFFMPFLIGLTLFNFFMRWDFGQREEIFVLLYMPFFILRWLTWQGRGLKNKWYAASIGVLGAVGICLKPYFLIPAFLVELYFFLDKRKWRPLFTTETVACFLGGVVYMAHFLFVPASMRESYFGFIVPVFKLGYSFWDVSLSAMYAPPEKRDVFFLMTVSCLLAVALRKRTSLMLPLVAFVMAGNIPYLLQFKGWPYHNQPVYASAFMLLCMELGFLKIAIAAKLHHWVKIPRRAALGLLVLLVLGIAVHDAIHDKTAADADKKFDMARIGYKGMTPLSDVNSNGYAEITIDNAELGDSVVFISNGVTPGYPFLTQLRCKPGSRHLHSVLLSVLSYIKDCQPHTAENEKLWKQEARIVKEYGEDILKNKPKLIFLQKLPDYFEGPHNFTATYLQDYIELPGDYENFRIFKRKREEK